MFAMFTNTKVIVREHRQGVGIFEWPLREGETV
jgi:hypothetical protein